MNQKSDWKTQRIRDLIDSLESGVSVNGDDRVPSMEEPAMLKVSAVTYGVFAPDAAKPIWNSEMSRAKCNPKKGQIIISRSNTPVLVGASAYVHQDYPSRFLPDKLWQTVPKKDVKIDFRWLSFFFASSPVRYKFSRLATGTSETMKNISKSEVLSLPLTVPPLPEQKAIAEILSTWDEAIERASSLEGIISPAYTVCTPVEKIDGLFSSYLFKVPKVIHLFYRYSQGLTSDTWNLKYRHFKEIKVRIPPLGGQKKIANVFQYIDKELHFLESQVNHLKTQKRGLMQKLLTGQWRVNLDKGA